MNPNRAALLASFALTTFAVTGGCLAACSDGKVADGSEDADGSSAVDPAASSSNDDASRVEDGSADANHANLDATDARSDADAGGPELRITFEAKVGTLPFQCGTTYAQVGTPPRDFTPVDFRFYVHDIRLVDATGVEIPLKLQKSTWQYQNVALLDFEDGTGSCNDGDAPRNAEILAQLPVGFTPGGLKFRVGVPLSLNHEDLSAQPPPLDKSSLFWAWRSGHIFFAAVARTSRPIDAGPDVDAGNAPYNHYTHLGSVDCTGDPSSGIPVTSCAKPDRPEISFASFDPVTNKVVVDFAAVKDGTDMTEKGCHADGEHCAAAYGRLGIDWSTGGYTTVQSVFRVE